MKSASSAFALGLLVLCLPSRPALAATPTASFGVSAIVQATCLVLASGVKFGTYAEAMVKATSTVSVNCTNSTPYSISLNSGSANDADVASPKMAETDSALLRYALASNPLEVVDRGRMLDTDTVAGSGNGSAQALPVFGKFSAEGHVAAGAYANTIAVTIIF